MNVTEQDIENIRYYLGYADTENIELVEFPDKIIANLTTDNRDKAIFQRDLLVKKDYKVMIVPNEIGSYDLGIYF